MGSASDNSDSVVCHTDLSTCCSGGQGPHRGNWYFPDGTVLPFSGISVPIGLGRGSMIASERSGVECARGEIYVHCEITITRI